MDVINNSIEHLRCLSNSDRTLIQHYTYEIDLDDWDTSPLLISYEVINFVLKQYTTSFSDLDYIPKLMTIITQQDMKVQIENAKRLQHILDTFPRSKDDFYVYKGFMQRDTFFQKVVKILDFKNTSKDATIVLPYFISTSVHFNVAQKFTDKLGMKCVCRIRISKGTSVPFIRDTYSNGTEDEVLLNIGGKYRVLSANYDLSTNIYLVDMELVEYHRHYYLKQFWNSINKIGCSTLQKS